MLPKPYLLLFLTKIILTTTTNKNLIIKKNSMANQRNQNQSLAKNIYNKAITTKKTRLALGQKNELNIAILHAAMKNIPTTSKYVNTFKELRQIYSARLIQDYTNYMENLQTNLKEKMMNFPEYKNFKLNHSVIIKKMKKFFARHKLKSFVTYHLRRDDLWGTHFLNWIDFFRLQKYFFGPFKYYILDCYKIRHFKSMCKEFFRDHVPLLDIPFPPQQKEKFINYYNVEASDNILDEKSSKLKIVKKDKTGESEDVIRKENILKNEDFGLIKKLKNQKSDIVEKEYFKKHDQSEENVKVDINVSNVDKTFSEEKEDSLSSLSSEEDINNVDKSESIEDKHKIDIKINNKFKKGKSDDEKSKNFVMNKNLLINKKLHINDNTLVKNESNLPLILRKDHIKKHLDIMDIKSILLKLKKLKNKRKIVKEVDIKTVLPPIHKRSDNIISQDAYLNFFDKDLTEEIPLQKIKIKNEFTDYNPYQDIINQNNFKIDNDKNQYEIYRNYKKKNPDHIPIINGKIINNNVSRNTKLDKLTKIRNNMNIDISKNDTNNIKIIEKDNSEIKSDIFLNTLNSKNIDYNLDIEKLKDLQKRKKLINIKNNQILIKEKDKFNKKNKKSSSEEEVSIEDEDKLKIITNKKDSLVKINDEDPLINKKIVLKDFEEEDSNEKNNKLKIIPDIKNNLVKINDDEPLVNKKIVIPEVEKNLTPLKKKTKIKNVDNNKKKQFVRLNGRKYFVPNNIKIKKKKNVEPEEKPDTFINKTFSDLLSVKIDKFLMKKQDEKYLPKKDEIKINNNFIIPKLITNQDDKINKYKIKLKKVDQESPEKKQINKKNINSLGNSEINEDSVTRNINQDYMNKMLKRYFVENKNVDSDDEDKPTYNREDINYFIKRRKNFDPKNNLLNKGFMIEKDSEQNGNSDFRKKVVPSILDEINNYEGGRKIVKKRRIITEVVVIELVDCEECLEISYMDIFLNN